MAPGKDGVTVDMMSAEVLFDVWCACLRCANQEYGMVPSVSSGSCPEVAIKRYMRHRKFLRDISDIYSEQGAA